MKTQGQKQVADTGVCLFFFLISFGSMLLVWYLEESAYSLSNSLNPGDFTALLLYTAIITAVPVSIYFLLKSIKIGQHFCIILSLCAEVIPVVWLILIQVI